MKGGWRLRSVTAEREPQLQRNQSKERKALPMQTTILKLNRMAFVGLFVLLLVMSGLSACGSTPNTTSGGVGAAAQQTTTSSCDEGCRALHRLPASSDCDEGVRALAKMGMAAACRSD
jgi:hypothetical protein